MAGCIAHARNRHISTPVEKSDVTIVFLDPNFLYDAIRVVLHIFHSGEKSHVTIVFLDPDFL